MKANKVIRGYLVEIEGESCSVSKGAFHASFECLLHQGTLHSRNFEEEISVPDDVIGKIEEWVKENI